MLDKADAVIDGLAYFAPSGRNGIPYIATLKMDYSVSLIAVEGPEHRRIRVNPLRG